MFNMKNPKTTWTGYVLLAGAVFTVVGTLFSGGDLQSALENALYPALAGLGFVVSSDGSK